MTARSDSKGDAHHLEDTSKASSSTRVHAPILSDKIRALIVGIAIPIGLGCLPESFDVVPGRRTQ
jgi:hypothetical protein